MNYDTFTTTQESVPIGTFRKLDLGSYHFLNLKQSIISAYRVKSLAGVEPRVLLSDHNMIQDSEMPVEGKRKKSLVSKVTLGDGLYNLGKVVGTEEESYRFFSERDRTVHQLNYSDLAGLMVLGRAFERNLGGF